jgi:PhnB protein
MVDVKNTYRSVTPYLVVPDADAELSFLKGAFEGTEVECHRNPDNTVMHAELRLATR